MKKEIVKKSAMLHIITIIQKLRAVSVKQGMNGMIQQLHVIKGVKKAKITTQQERFVNQFVILTYTWFGIVKLKSACAK